MKLLNMEIKRMFRSRIIQLTIILLILIGALAMVLYNIYYRSRNDSRYVLLSLYNSYTQFTYLVLSFVFVSTFCKDFQNGVYAWYNQLNYSFGKVCITKFISLFLTVLPLINIVFISANFISGNRDFNYFMLSTTCVNLDVIYIIMLAFFISVIFKKVVQSTLIMYGIYVIFNGINLMCYGLINPADSNSISSYYLGKLIITQSHYSLDKISLSDNVLCSLSIFLPIIWTAVLLFVVIFIKNRRKV